MFALLNAALDQTTILRGVALALRGPAMIRNSIFNLAVSQGFDLRQLLGPEDSATRAEVKELAEPLLKKGAEFATFAQMADTYVFSGVRTPESIVYTFYIGIRYAVARERMPTKEESGQIWETALRIARASKIGEPHWQELEARGPQYLEDWINERKEDARKKYQTFLSQKRRAEATAQEGFEALMAEIFGEDEAEGPKSDEGGAPKTA
ncbi:MAG TPA: hypothetical protein VHU19_00390 [Pyrinomonadaceae bacterium]|nr:hypothetical protein [Pyrinomonadaceae bacterium]